MTPSPTTAESLARLERAAAWLDDRFRVPGLGLRFGLDPLIGLIPGVGDAVTAVFTAALIAHAERHHLPFRAKLGMLGNLGLDWLLGSVPLAGDLFDFGFRANRRNLAILKRHLGLPPGG